MALNRGQEHGVMAGDIYTVASDDIIDPETGENLGGYSRLRVKVIEVYPKFCVAETYRIVGRGERPEVTVRIGDPALPWPPADRT
jgi:hypothetical protein